MSTSCGACGAYGILLADIDANDFPEALLLRKKLQKYLDEGDENGTWMEKMYNSPAEDPKVKRFRKPFIEAFRKRGIAVPDTAVLIHTGDEDDRPAAGGDPPEEWVLGFGLFKRPHTYPKLARSFIKMADWYTWVWMG
jgi:hypothetical protein